MTTPNVFPPDILQEIRDLKATVQQLQAAAARRTPLTEASQGWKLGAMSPPDTGTLGPDDVHIYADSGQLRVASQGNDIALGEIPFGPPVDDPPAQTATPLPSGQTVLGADYNKLGQDIDAVWQALVALNAVLRGGQFPT